MTIVKSNDPITGDLMQVATAIREAYRQAHTSEQRVALHQCASRIADKVWDWMPAEAQTTLHRRFMHLCFKGEVRATEHVQPPMPVEVLQVESARLARAGEVAYRINEAARP